MTSVYFISPGTTHSPVKIGYSKALYVRRKQLAAWSPYPLLLLAELPGGCVVERQFHDLFKADRSHGEWFHWTPNLGRVIAEISAGTFSRNELPAPRFLSWSDKYEMVQLGLIPSVEAA